MSSILYIGKDYCHTLKQLQEYFRHISSDQDALYNELLTLQRDGLIAQWLEEGSETEKTLAKRLNNLPTNLTNKELMEKLAEILTNKNKNFNVNLHSYLELKEISYALVKPLQTEVTLKVIRKGDIINITKEHLNGTLRLKLKFKILKPEKETFSFKTTLSLQQQTIHEVNTDLDLNNEPIGKAKVLVLNIPINLLKKDVDAYLFEVKNDTQTIFSAKVSLGIPDVFTLNGVNFKMIKVEGGTFKMGSSKNDSAAYENEKPQHDVTLNEFHIGVTVVTQALWKAVMKRNPSSFKGDDLPVERVSYNDITDFLRKLNELLRDQLHGKKFALPTEEQWEFAARGGVKSKGYKYSGSNDIAQVAWYSANSGVCTHPVKEKGKIPNELGIYGMSGTVWEWCESYWRINYNANPDRFARVLRGGGWFNVAGYCRVAYRGSYAPDHRYCYLGFRLVLQ